MLKHDVFIAMSLVCHLNHQHALLVLASCIAIGELARCAALPLPSGSSSTSVEDQNTAIWKLDLVKKLFAIMNNSKLTTKVSKVNNKCIGFNS
jgi:hypothetical protein